MPDALLRPLLIAAIFAALLVAERLWSARAAVQGRRWGLNLGLGLGNLGLAFVLSALFPLAAAHWAAGAGVGLWHWIALPAAPALLLTLVLLDLAVYWQHRMMHAVPLLWSLHRLHHRDIAMDVTTGVRFHPGEIAVSGFWKSGIVILLGASPAAVLLFETLLTAASLWEHANLRLPPWLDRRLRHLLVTPAMHLVHHGRDGGDMQFNFGFSTSLWDHMFGSYRETPNATALGAE